MSHRLAASSARIADTSRVERIEHAWIPLADGTRLAARIWLPDDALEHPVPAILEAIPYRKNDATLIADEGRHAWFAANGYAGVRLDIRGSGDSDGLLADEYLRQEQDDAIEVIAWLAGQPWCSGAVGMIGYSWGGFAALQVAARRPPQLRAIVAVDSTDDRYADDVHYMGGCVLSYFMLSWAASMQVAAALPPDPEVVGERWREMWLGRLQGSRPMIEPWLSHQLRDDYWRHGSVCEDFSAVECPVLTVSGWADGYRDATLRLLEGLQCPRRGLIGPWSHTYPVEAQPPGPAIGFLQEVRRWFDHWLKGEDQGVLDDPLLRAWMQDPVAPAPQYAERPGRWVAEHAWPSPHITDHVLHLSEHRLGTEPGEPAVLVHTGSLRHGADAGDWDPFGEPADMPVDQRAEDGLSLTFTSAPLEQPLELLGRPVARLSVACDQPDALLVVRLCDVDEEGRSYLITRGLLNLTHRHGHDRAMPLEPGELIEVEVPMKSVGQHVPAGHRLRLSVSTTYWPWAWPSPRPVRIELHTDSSSAVLPVRAPRPEDSELRPFDEPELASRPAAETLELQPSDHVGRHTVGNGEHVLEHRYPHLRTWLPETGIEIETSEPDVFTVRGDDPLSARVRCDRLHAIGRPHSGWSTKVELESEMTADANEFHVWSVLRAFEGDACIFARTWSFDIPRQGV